MRYKYTIADEAGDSVRVVTKREFIRSLAYNCAVAAAYGDDPDGQGADQAFEALLFQQGFFETTANGFVYTREEINDGEHTAPYLG